MAFEPLNRLAQATLVSLTGLRDAFRTELALRLEVLVFLVVVPVAWFLTSAGLERALLIGSWMLVIVVEMVNSAIEAAVDRIGRERHELSRRAKDFGSAAVFCAIVHATVVWALVLSF
jgi:diacylglycerol kinase (ATP)